jgi:Actinobacteria/chloroflexi VLRF1 release factor
MKKSILSRPKTLAFINYLSASPNDIDLSLYLPPRLPATELESLLKEINAPASVSAQLAEIITPSPTGASIFWGKKTRYLVVPPFPVQDKAIFQSFGAAPLLSLISHDYLIGLVLVRLGSYAIGVCRGDNLVNSKVGTGLIHGRHRQGGSSAHRFERHRDKQIESFLIRVCGHAREQLEPHVKAMDYVVYGGARTTILMAQKYCPFLEKIAKPVLPPLLDIPEPRRPVLESAVSRVWSSTIYDFSDY